MLAPRLTPLYDAVIVRVNVPPTLAVCTAKLPTVAPAGIVRVDGTVIAELLEVRVTVAPPSGAAVVSVTVPVVVSPPFTVDGSTIRVASSCCGFRVIVAVRRTSPASALIYRVTVLATLAV